MKKKESIIILICAIIIILSIVLFFVIASENRNKNSFEFNKQLSDTIITIEKIASSDSSDENISSDLTNDSENARITLKEFSYYILVMEANVNHTAALYNPNNLNSYWNLYINNTFVKAAAKDTAMDMCIRDNIYYMEALNNGFTLDDNEQSETLDEASYIYSNLTGKQVNATELTMEEIYEVRYKINLATKYISYLMEENNCTEKELNVDGSYYTGLYDNYDIDIADIWNEIELGDITIE